MNKKKININSISYVTRKNPKNTETLEGMSTRWKSGKIDDFQRTPDITTDIILFHKVQGELCVLAGMWTKEWNGRLISGLTFIPGGHYERMGYRPDSLVAKGADPKGDLNLIEASKKELREETGITSVKNLTPIAMIDFADNDPRKHTFRSVFAGITTGVPKENEEIQVFYSIPFKKLKGFVNKGYITSAYKTVKGNTYYVEEKIPFVLGHDEMMRILIKLPQFKDYIKKYFLSRKEI